VAVSREDGLDVQREFLGEIGFDADGSITNYGQRWTRWRIGNRAPAVWFSNRRQADAESRQSSLPNSKNRHIQMNKSALSIACALVVASTAFAAEVVTTTTTSTGTIHEYSPGTTFVVKESSGPVKYRYSKKVTYVTKGGKTLTDDEVKTRIKVGVPVSVHYATEGEDRVINKIEVDDD
jgi:hypothetical protein